MRVALIIYGSLDTPSGGYLYDRKMVECFRAAGDEVCILSLPWQNYPRHLAHNFSRALWRRLKDLKVDFLLQDELNHPSLFLINRRLLAKAPYPVLSIVHHLRSSEENPAVLRWLYRQVEKAFLRGVHGHIFNSAATRHAVETLAGGPVVGVVANPGRDHLLAPGGMETAGSRFRQDGPLRLLFIGNLIRRKGLHTLIEALGMVRDEPWMLEVAGRAVDGRYFREIKRQIELQKLGGRVSFCGEVADAEMPGLFSRNHVLVVPSYYEGYGIVYMEGMAFGLLPLASSAGGAAEIIEDRKNGFLLPPGDAAQLAGIIRGLCRDREMLYRMSQDALRRFQEFPTWQESARKVREFLLSWPRGSQ